jgi:dihydropyrimidinase
MRLYVRNARLDQNGEILPLGLLCEDGKITRILRANDCPAPDLDQALDALPNGPGMQISQTDGSTAIDAGGLLLLPGGVDPHTHFDLDIGFTKASDNFATGSVAALCGGTTTVIDHMAFGPDGCHLLHQYSKYQDLAKDCSCDYGLHGVLQHLGGTVIDDFSLLKDKGVSSLKLYMTYAFKLDHDIALKALQRAKELDMTVCVHCEDDSLLQETRRRFVSEGKTNPSFHGKSRPPEAEAIAVRRILDLARKAGDARIYVVHLSTALGLEEIRKARKAGQENIFAETCPQYLLLDESAYDRPDALKYVMSPPIRSKSDAEALWDGLAKGDIDTIGTDHCPFFYETQKQRGASDFALAPNGAPGVELRMPLMLSEGFLKRKISLSRVIELCCSNPARIFGLSQKGSLNDFQDADFALYSTEDTAVTAESLHENVDYTPYEGMILKASPKLTVLRGELMAANGKFLGSKGTGSYIFRK